MTPVWLKPAAFLLFIATLAAGYYLYGRYAKSLNTDSTALVPTNVVLRLEPKMRETAFRLNSDPCNRTLSFQLAGALLRDYSYSALIRMADSLKAMCGPNSDLLASVFTAQTLMSDYVGAEKTGDELIASYPAASTSYGWRALAREKNGNVAGAYADLQIAVGLVPDPKTIAFQSYFDLARLADGAGKPCEAIATLRDYVAFDALHRQTPQITTLTADWQKKAACPALAAAGSASLHYDMKPGVIVLPVEINGIVVKMVIDTGATRTALTEELANRLGIAYSDKQGATVTTANGKIMAAGGRAKYISLGGARLNDVPVFVQKAGFGDGVDGLLGLSFLGNFQVKMSNGTLELKPIE